MSIRLILNDDVKVGSSGFAMSAGNDTTASSKRRGRPTASHPRYVGIETTSCIYLIDGQYRLHRQIRESLMRQRGSHEILRAGVRSCPHTSHHAPGCKLMLYSRARYQLITQARD